MGVADGFSINSIGNSSIINCVKGGNKMKKEEVERFTELVKEFFVPAIKEMLRSEINKIKNIEGKVELIELEIKGLRKENFAIKAGIGRKIFNYLSKEEKHE